MNLTAVDACCICGGGTTRTVWKQEWPDMNIHTFDFPTAEEIRQVVEQRKEEKKERMGQCHDMVGFQDKFGEGCDFYDKMCECDGRECGLGERGAPKRANPEQFEKFAAKSGTFQGVSALDACCMCGG